MHTPFLIAIAVYFLDKATTIGAQTCYFPDGSESPRDTPCRAPSPNQASPCCAYSDICLDNSLCLAQSGRGVLSRGTCTDSSWQSSECARFCQDINTDWGAPVDPVRDGSVFCCGSLNTSSNTCLESTQGSNSPFDVPYGRVIYNRTSGAILPVNSDIATVTDSATATIIVTPSPTTSHNSPCSSNKPTAVGVGVGIPLGLALLGALGMMWRQRSRELGARSEARAWEEKHAELGKEKREDLTSAGVQMQELGHGWTPPEIDGKLVPEGAGGMR